MLDIGTGTGRMLELFADRYERALGVDLSPAMLAVARANLERAGIDHARVRIGDVMNLPVAARQLRSRRHPPGAALPRRPGAAIAEAAGALSPGGRLLVVDFAPHELEFLRAARGASPARLQPRADGAMDRRGRTDARSGGGSRPEAKSGGLTVTIWTARDRRAASAGRGKEEARLMTGTTSRRCASAARDLLRVLSAEERGAGGDARRYGRAARALPARTTCRSPTAPAAPRRSARSAPCGSMPERALPRPRTSPAPARAARRSRETIDAVPRHAASSASSRCAAIRRAACRSPTVRIRTAFATPPTWLRALKRAGAVEVSVSAYPERHPHSADWDTEIGDAEAQGRCRRRSRHHPVLLRQRSLRGLSSSASAAPASASRSCRASCRSIASPRRLRLRQPLRRNHSGEPRAALRWARSGFGDASRWSRRRSSPSRWPI